MQEQESNKMITVVAVFTDIPCIIAIENFEAVCLNRDVLWAALVSLHDRRVLACRIGTGSLTGESIYMPELPTVTH